MRLGAATTGRGADPARPVNSETAHNRASAAMTANRPPSRLSCPQLGHAGTQLLEPRTYLRDHGQVLLPLVAVKRLPERLGGFIGAAGAGEHLGEVAQGRALHVQSV